MTDKHNQVKAGFVAIARSLREHYVVGFCQPVVPADKNKGAYSRAEAWLDLIMECRYETGRAMNCGHPMTLRPGEMIGAISWLAGRWNWTPKAVRGFLDNLEREGMIARFMVGPDGDRVPSKQGNRGGNHANIISICNYATYQIVEAAGGQHLRQPKGNRGATEGQPRGNTLTKEQDNNNTPLTPLEGEQTKPNRRCSLPATWEPNLDWVKERWQATDRELQEQAERFRDYHTAKGSTMKDWDAAWRTWWNNGFHGIKRRTDQSATAGKSSGFTLDPETKARLDREYEEAFQRARKAAMEGTYAHGE